MALDTSSNFDLDFRCPLDEKPRLRGLRSLYFGYWASGYVSQLCEVIQETTLLPESHTNHILSV